MSGICHFYNSNRKGAKGAWTRVKGTLKSITSGKLGVFGVNVNNHIYYRIGTLENNFSVGKGWQRLPGKLMEITAGRETVWGVNKANKIYYMRLGCSAFYDFINFKISAIYNVNFTMQILQCKFYNVNLQCKFSI